MDLRAIATLIGISPKSAHNAFAFDRRDQLKSLGQTGVGPDSRSAFFDSATACAIAITLGVGSIRLLDRGDLLHVIRKVLLQWYAPELRKDEDDALPPAWVAGGCPKRIRLLLDRDGLFSVNRLYGDDRPTRALQPSIEIDDAVIEFTSRTLELEEMHTKWAARHIVRRAKEKTP